MYFTVRPKPKKDSDVESDADMDEDEDDVDDEIDEWNKWTILSVVYLCHWKRVVEMKWEHWYGWQQDVLILLSYWTQGNH